MRERPAPASAGPRGRSRTSPPLRTARRRDVACGHDQAVRCGRRGDKAIGRCQRVARRTSLRTKARICLAASANARTRPRNSGTMRSSMLWCSQSRLRPLGNTATANRISARPIRPSCPPRKRSNPLQHSSTLSSQTQTRTLLIY